MKHVLLILLSWLLVLPVGAAETQPPRTALVADEGLVVQLSAREVEVLGLLHRGVPRKAVGRLLDPPAADATVATYLRRAVQKYRAAGRRVDIVNDAVHEAQREGWFD